MMEGWREVMPEQTGAAQSELQQVWTGRGAGFS